jgi:beta-mannosidase
MARVRSVEGTRSTPLVTGWHMAAAPAGSIPDPTGLEAPKLDWIEGTVPATAASTLRAASKWTIDDRVDFDRDDWWWRCRFPAPSIGGSVAHHLRFGGLASLADVWLNGHRIVASQNMFVEHDAAVEGLLRADNELVLCCRSVASALKARRPRPRWRTRLVEAQQLRWIRTTLFGRIPAWTPAVAPVGPWRGVTFEERSLLDVVAADLRPRLEGGTGVVDVALTLRSTEGVPPELVSITVGETSTLLACTPSVGAPGEVVARGALRVANVALWWPHTHGEPRLYPAKAAVTTGGRTAVVDLGTVGFRAVQLSQDAGGFALRVNGADVFCRGACWTPVDAASLSGPPESYRATLESVRAVGMNMIRISGPFFYEDDALYETCDELGILVWQDYPFANMDYPGDDPDFTAEVEREARGFLSRTQTCASLAVLCGNSEVEQQAAMFGAPRGIWRSPLFATTLAKVSADGRPDVPYWPSTPSGGPLPFSNDSGTAHYFGVGGYLRPLADARRAGVHFATECLAFANVPDAAVVDELTRGGGTPPQDPRWKARTPRDSATGWDFDDVRDHYFQELLGLDPGAVRYCDVPRYLALSRVVSGEAMAATFAEWRRPGSGCNGALIWLLRDLWPGAGWGVLDSHGRPKAPYHYLRRVLQPLAVVMTDEGLNGLAAHVVNDGPVAFQGALRFACYRGETAVATASREVRVAEHAGLTLRASESFDHFVDSTYAYRFGPPQHDVTVATLTSSAGVVLSEAFHFPRALPSTEDPDLGLTAVATPMSDGAWRATVSTRRLAVAVELEVRGFEPEDNYFHLEPGRSRDVALRPLTPLGGLAGAKPQGSAKALNAPAAARLEVKP